MDVTARASNPGASRRYELRSAQRGRCPAHVLLFHPQQRAVAALARTDCIDRSHVDPGTGQPREQRFDRARPVITLNQETGFSLVQHPFCSPRHCLEGRTVIRNEIDLPARSARKSREAEQIDARPPQDLQDFRRHTRFVGNGHCEIIDFPCLVSHVCLPSRYQSARPAL